MKQIYVLLLIVHVILIPAAAQEHRPSLSTRNGQRVQLKTVTNEPPGSESLQRLRYKNKQYLLIQFNRIPGAAEKQAMARQGIQLFDYLPGNIYMAEVRGDIAPATLKDHNASGVFTIEPQQKISPKLNAPLIGANRYVAVSFYGNIPRSEVIAALQKEGATMADTKIQPPNTIFVHAGAATIKNIAALPFVSYISAQTVKDETLNNTSRGVHGISALALPSGRNLQGEGVVVGVGDNGDPSTHIDFTGRLINRNPLPPADHGTHVTGTVGGAGLITERYKGMAPKVTLISQASSDILVHTPAYIGDFGMVLTNNSYHSVESSCPGEGEYDVLSNYIDAQLLDYPQLMHVFAAGNDGREVCSPYPPAYATVKSGFQSAKNVLTVGGLDNSLLYFDINASRGPVGDGRLKPEICAGSVSVNSTRVGNGYGPMWGTSMAAPAATGALALLYERYRQLNGGANPKGALMKALVVCGADDIGNAGPDFTYGFGSLNARNAVEILENNQFFTGSVNNGGTVNLNITGVPAGVHQLKVLVYWADAPAAPMVASALVNNLDMTVTAPGGTVHRPLILNPTPAGVTNLAVEGVDNVNNIEEVVIDNPPAGDFTITITGANVPVGPQEYFVAYQVINPGVVLESPFGSEKWAPNDVEFIRWNAFGGDGNSFTIEYSTDNGSSWLPVATVPDTARVYAWTIPNTATGMARVRVTRNNTAYSDANDVPFTILGQPLHLGGLNPCYGYQFLRWDHVDNASGYEILLLRGSEFVKVGSTAAMLDTTFLLTGLWKDSTYCATVRALIDGTSGRYAFSRIFVPGAGTCSLPEMDNDFTIDSLISPVTGRMNTSTQLGTGAIRVRVRNLDNVVSSGNWNISYQVNGGAVVTEPNSSALPLNGAILYSFAPTIDFSAPGTYTIKVWVDHVGDTQKFNDTIVRVVKQLQNDPITLNPSFTEGFESATEGTYEIRTLGLDGVDRADFNTNTNNGRARTFINTGMARSGNRAVTLDQKRFSLSPTTDSLTTTFNLSSYNAADQLWLDFYYLNHGVDFTAPNNRVWIRGSDLDAWIPVYSLPTNDPSHFGVYRASPPINITETLAGVVPAQTVSSSFQVKFGEQGYNSANSLITDGNLDDGFTFDDIKITKALNDVGILALVSPNLTSICGLSSSETIEVRVKNYSSGVVNNVAVSYKINGTTVNEVIPSINPGQILVYSFSQTANLAAFQEYTLDAWVNYPADNYQNNDSLLNIVFHTTPVITTYPYLEGFETNNGYWYTGGIVSSWQWGAPANSIINKAANGNNAWVTSLAGNYNNGEQSYLYSPCFDLSSLVQPVFSFSHIFRNEDDCDCDFHWVEYSLDDVNWIKLGNASGGTNWYDQATLDVWQVSYPNWHVSSYDVPVTASKVRFRIVMSADPALNFEGVGIDDVHVFDKAAVYTGADITSGLTQAVSGNNWIHFTQGGKRIVSINSNGQDLGNTQVKVFFNNTGSDRYSNTQYYLDRNIVIQPANAPTGNVSVRFYFTDEEAANLMNATGCGYCNTIGDAYEAGVTQYSNAPAEENGLLSDNASGLYNFITPAQVLVVPYDNGYYAEYQVSNFSEFWINSGGTGADTPLPAELGSFTAIKRNGAGLLEWITKQEADLDRFVVEKSLDGAAYQSIGEVKAVGNSTNSQRYRFTDVRLMNGTNYYRLKIIDINGKASYSPIRLLTVAGNEAIITLYPNPVRKGILYVNTNVNCRRIDIADVTGRILKSIQGQGTQLMIPMQAFAKGTYIITVVTDNGKKVEKLVLE